MYRGSVICWYPEEGFVVRVLEGGWQILWDLVCLG